MLAPSVTDRERSERSQDPAPKLASKPSAGRRRAWEPLPTHSRAPTPVRDALDQLASTMGLASVDGLTRLFMSWSDIVGEELAKNCEPKRLSDGRLTVQAADHQWVTELSWMTELIVDRCTEALGPGKVTEVRIVRGSEPGFGH